MLTGIFTAVGVLALAAPATAQDCRLALILALDVSSTVDPSEDRLQREGLAHALTSPEVVRAFLVGDPVTLYVFQWSGATSQVPMLPGWMTVESEADLVRVAGAIAASERVSTRYRTAVGAALVHAAAAFAAGPACRARTVDVSGDGVNNQGAVPQAVYGSHLLDGVTVNALLIRKPPGDERHTVRTDEDGQLVSWFQSAVLHGRGAFHIVADGYEDYERAMTAKLLRELEMPMMSGGIRGALAG